MKYCFCFCCSCYCYCCCCCSCYLCCCCLYGCCWSHKPTFKVWLKSGQEQLRYWWHWVCGGGGGLKSFSCHTQLLSWVEVELGLWQYRNVRPQLGYLKIFLLKWMICFSQNKVLVDLPNESFVFVDSKFCEERFPNLRWFNFMKFTAARTVLG